MRQRKFFLGIYFITSIIFAGVGYKNDSLLELYQRGKLQLSEIQRIHIDSVPDNVTLNMPSSITLNSKGDLFIADITGNNVKIFDSRGDFIKTFGQRGSGPGDLNAPWWLSFNGKYIIIWEIYNRRFSLFKENGQFVRVVNPPQIISVKNIRALKNGLVIVESEKISGGKQATQECIITVYTPEMKEKKVLYRHPIKTRMTITKPKPMPIPIPFPPLVSWDILSNNIVLIGFQGEYRIGLYDVEKGKLSEFQHDFQPVKISDEDKDNFFKGITVATSRSTYKQGAPDYVVKNTTFPKFKPAFNRILVDPADNILVFPNSESRSEKQTQADVFDAQGKFVGRVDILGRLGRQTIFADSQTLWTLFYIDREWNIVKYKVDRP